MATRVTVTHGRTTVVFKQHEDNTWDLTICCPHETWHEMRKIATAFNELAGDDCGMIAAANQQMYHAQVPVVWRARWPSEKSAEKMLSAVLKVKRRCWS